MLIPHRGRSLLLSFSLSPNARAQFARLVYKQTAQRPMGALFSSSATPAAVDMSGPIADFVSQTISNNKVVIFSKTTCPYCSMAKEQFKKLNFNDVLNVELNQRQDGSEVQAYLGQLTGAATVPRVFVGGKFIGGGTDVKKLHDNGQLQKMLS